MIMRKNVPVIEISFFKFEAECREFAKMMRSPEQFIGTVKGQNIFLKQDTFKLVTGDSNQIKNIEQ